MLLAMALSACSNNKNGQEEASETKTQKSNTMKNRVSIIEIPVTDFSRSVKFYQTILGVTIEEVNMGETQMGVLPGDGKTVSVVLAKGNDYKTTTDGVVIYLNAGNDLQPTLGKVEKNGGQIIVPKTQISPDMGYFALFIDSEGNKLGLHSSN
jgi:predicted enzyme related to lactoylglutathione lyase